MITGFKRWSLAVTALGALTVASSDTLAATITGGGWTVESGATIYRTNPTQEWFIDDADLQISSSISGGGASAFFGDGVMDWTGNPLDFDDPSGGTRAFGDFGSGGSFTLSGSADFFGPGFAFLGSTPGFTSLIEGTVGGFRVEETASDSGNFDIVDGDVLVTVTGGFLASGNNPWLAFPPNATFTLDLSSVVLTNGQPDIEDFSMDIFSTGPMQMNLGSVVPEPGTLIGLGLMSGGVFVRRRLAG